MAEQQTDWSAHLFVTNAIVGVGDKRLYVMVRNPKETNGGPGPWKLPGGGRRYAEEARALDASDDESPIETAIRELREETGLNVRSHNLHLQFADKRQTHTKYVYLAFVNDVYEHSVFGGAPDYEEIGLFTMREIYESDEILPQHKQHFEAVGYSPEIKPHLRAVS